MTSILSIGILCDDNVLINQAIVYFKNEEGRYKEAGNIKMQFLFCIRIRILMRFWDSVKSRDVTKGMHIVCVIDGGILSDGL